MKKLLQVLASAILFQTSYAEISTPRVFADNMMLQASRPIKIWGKANPLATVKITIADSDASFNADEKGDWLTELPPMNPNEKPFSVKFFENGKLSKEIKNVLVGEVWIAGGQSNMDFKLERMDGSKEIIADSADDCIRYFIQGDSDEARNPCADTPQKNTSPKSEWLIANPKNSGKNFSAIAYIFARELRKQTGVPVAIVYTAISGTRMISWVDKKSFDCEPAFSAARNAFNERVKNYDFNASLKKYEDDISSYNTRVLSAKKKGIRPPEAWTVSPTMRPYKDTPDRWAHPCRLYNLRIAPLKNLSARGSIWYQGESDDNCSKEFKEYFSAFIKQWRRQLPNVEENFLCVQLPSFSNEKWIAIRDAQLQAVHTNPNAEIINAIDTGNKYDIHPSDKIEIGKRLARTAANKVYKKQVPCAFPKFESAEIKNNQIIINFNTFGEKLNTSTKPKGFEIYDGEKWSPAEADFKDGKISITLRDETKIKKVRYLWKAWAKPDVSVYNQNKLPAFPFCADVNKK